LRTPLRLSSSVFAVKQTGAESLRSRPGWRSFGRKAPEKQAFGLDKVRSGVEGGRMVPRELIDTADVPGGEPLRLFRRGGD
jgi:hypothetical protein